MDVNSLTKEDRAFFRLHGQIASTSIAGNRVPFGGLHKSIIHGPWGAQDLVRCVCCESEDEDDDETFYTQLEEVEENEEEREEDDMDTSERE